MRRSVLAILLLASCRKPAPPQDALTTILADDIKKPQPYLASEALEGRGPASEGAKKASAYIADQVKAWGFQPAGTDGTYFQPFGEGRRNVAALWPGSA